MAIGRSPRGERGLKGVIRYHRFHATGRSPRGERGLKDCQGAGKTSHESRSPRGERGLKDEGVSFMMTNSEVVPLAGNVD